MATGNLFLGTARGSVGDVTFSRRNSKQVSRVKVTQVSNPRSAGQYVQRICLSQVSKAYSWMQAICNHSFQGKTGAAQNQSRFLQLNLNLARAEAIRQINAAAAGKTVASTGAWNFIQKGYLSNGLAYCPYALSEGSINHTYGVFAFETASGTTPNVAVSVDGGNSPLAWNPNKMGTYQDACDLLGIQYGDQLTFVALTGHVDDESGEWIPGLGGGFTYARMILSPADGDASSSFLNEDSDDLIINSPNSRNMGSVRFVSYNETHLPVINGYAPFLGVSEYPSTAQYGALALIVSRQVSGVWQRSTESMTVGSIVNVGQTYADVLDSYKQDSSNVESDVYLNNATD